MELKECNDYETLKNWLAKLGELLIEGKELEFGEALKLKDIPKGEDHSHLGFTEKSREVFVKQITDKCEELGLSAEQTVELVGMAAHLPMLDGFDKNVEQDR